MTMDGMTMDGMTMTMTGMSMTGMSTATGTSSANDAGAAHKHNNTGPIVGGVVGGILGLALIAVGGWLLWRYLQSQNTHATPYQGNSANGHPGDQMAQHTATPYYGPGDTKTSSVYFGSIIQTPQQQPADLASNRLSYASHQPYPYSPAVSSPQAPFVGSASRDYDTSMFAALPPSSQVSSPPSQYGGNSTSSGGATQGPLIMANETGQTWTTNPITPPPPFAPSSSPGLPPGAKSPEYGKAQPIGYTSGVPEAMSVEGGGRI
ncbi:hypothetical protein FS837_010692 [Tulasnella sp. UAMH 9824]|nr:hypothetical protein FS837_010692 [Tulasnella sp. UAMH 9824]